MSSPITDALSTTTASQVSNAYAIASAGNKVFSAQIVSSGSTTTSTMITASRRTSLLKFEFISSGDGNNIYIDDIMFDGNVSSEELPVPAFDVNVAPNPFNDNLLLNISLARNEQISYRVTDLLGRVILEMPAKMRAAGDHAIPLDIQEPAGIYFLEVHSGSSVQTKKLIKN